MIIEKKKLNFKRMQWNIENTIMIKIWKLHVN